MSFDHLNDPWPLEKIRLLEKHYPRLGPRGLTEMLGYGWRRIYSKARRSGIKIDRSIYEDIRCNSDDVKNLIFPKTPEVSYILGLMWADGHIVKRLPRRGYCAQCTIVKEDFDTIKHLFEKTANWKYYDRQQRHWKVSTTAMINNKEFYEFLTENDFHLKSGNDCNKLLSKIRPDMRHYFWRGFFDGDGHVSSKSRATCALVSGPIDQDWTSFSNLLEKLNIKYSVYRTESKNGNYSKIGFYRALDIKKFRSYIYSGEPMGLERKRKVFYEIY